MKLLTAFLFLALVSTAQAEDQTLCEVIPEDAMPVQTVTIIWGEKLPREQPYPWSPVRQKIKVVAEGVRFYKSYEAIAEHRTLSTRVGIEHITHAQLNANNRLYIREVSQGFGEEAQFKSASLVIHEGMPYEKKYRLNCPSLENL